MLDQRVGVVSKAMACELWAYGGAKMYRIRRARPEDSVFLSEMNSQFNGASIDPAAIRLRLRKGDEIVLVALDGRRPIAFACAQIFLSFCYQKPYAEITELFVTAEHRRRGVGRKLMDAMESHLAKKKVVHIHILTFSNNKPARTLYESLGYSLNQKNPELLLEKNMKV